MTVTTETNITGSSNQGDGGGGGSERWKSLGSCGGDGRGNRDGSNGNTSTPVDTDGGNFSMALPRSNADLSSAGSLPPTFHDPSASLLRRDAAAAAATAPARGKTDDNDDTRNVSPLSGGGLWNRLHKQTHSHPLSPSTPGTGGTFGSSDQDSYDCSSFVASNDSNINHLQQPIIGLTHNIVSSHELSSSDRNHVSHMRATTTTTTGGYHQNDVSGTVVYNNNGPTSWDEMYASYTDPSRPNDRSGDMSSRDRVENIRRILRVSNAITEVTNADIERVRVVYRRFYEGSILSFNYNCLLGISSIIAALGLAADSSATIIASMLVSPLMGPVVGMAYGQSIGDKKLTITALQTELISLAVCVVTGMACGICMAPFEVASTWPTSEMLSRSTLRNLYFGIPIAFFSGLGVAVSLLDDQTSSLVGVAISASLLPPAVNAGLLLINAFVYEREHFTDPDYDRALFYKGGAISFGLTLVNIVLIIVSSMIMFRVKERLPIRRKKIFWTDLRLARKIYSNKAIKKQESINFDTPNPVVNQARAVGKRVSTFITSPFVANTNNDNASDINNGDQSELNSASIPHGIVDQQRTVVETIAEEGRESDLSNV